MEAKHVRAALTVLLLGILACACGTAAYLSGIVTAHYLPAGVVKPCENGLLTVAVPPGVPVVLEDEGMTVTLTEAVRPADEIVAEGSSFNPEPGPGQEFVQVKLTVACDEGNEDTCSFYGLSLLLVGTRGVYGQQSFVFGVEGDDDLQDIPPGEEGSGAFYFIVATEEKDLVLVYKSLFGDGTAYFALEK